MKSEVLSRVIDRVPLSEPVSPYAPHYRGLEWLDTDLPTAHRPWPARDNRLVVVAGRGDPEEATHGEIKGYVAPKLWVFPDRPIFFLCDQHADADAFLRSLVASGGIARTGRRDDDFVLTGAGRDALFVIGGDCLDKGPNNLRMLRVLKALIDSGADVEILAGNHDLRFLVGLRYAERKDDPLLAHLFVRMGQKAVPMFKEVYDGWLRNARRPRPIADARARTILFPPASWYDAFPRVARAVMPPARIEKEVRRIREKTVEMEARAARMGLSLGMVHAVVETCRRQFLEPGGEFAWYFQRMKLAHRAGSFLLVHAGVDDVVAEAIRSSGVDGVNRWFRRLLETNPFDLYNGPVGNAFRTKYRPGDWPLTASGAADMHRAGLYAIVHGHRNILHGQRIVMREGLLNFECDASVDRNTRVIEGLAGPGGAVTMLRPDGKVLGISTDFPYIKLFDPAALDAVATIV